LTNKARLPASFRDPAGFLYREGSEIFRQINPAGYDDYFAAINSGLYEKLVSRGWLVSHQEVSSYSQDSPPEAIIIKPEHIPFISYPYEWSFSQLKDAARLTLQLQKTALEAGLSLKDCSAYNIQFLHGRPVLVDTLSFERYREGEPWAAYRQFCQHFLAPLALMSYVDVRLGQLLRVYIDGIPLDLTSRLLPRKSSLNLGLNMHIHLHARSQERMAEKQIEKDRENRKMHKHQLLGLVENLASAVEKLAWKPEKTDWAEYESFHNYSKSAREHKTSLVDQYLAQTDSKTVWDLGANTGIFSRIASGKEINTIAFDIDPGAVEINYQRAAAENDRNLLPLVLDLANPSPGLGWSLEERDSLLERGPAETVLALALIHHLAIGNNVPFPQLAEFFSRICRWLIIEFVPKSDPQVGHLLQVREDIFTDYNRESFVESFRGYFDLVSEQDIRDSERSLFLFKQNS
jgi:ribosomal protein L11 methylase PrmA